MTAILRASRDMPCVVCSGFPYSEKSSEWCRGYLVAQDSGRVIAVYCTRQESAQPDRTGRAWRHPVPDGLFVDVNATSCPVPRRKSAPPSWLTPALKPYRCHFYYPEPRTELRKLLYKSGERKFASWSRKVDGRWVRGLNGIDPHLYGLPILRHEMAHGNKAVLVLEGERDVDCARALGALATCGPHGVAPWPEHYLRELTDADVSIIPDRDPVGEKFAAQLMQDLAPFARSVRLLTVRGGKDFADHVAAGFGLADLMES